jgi:hypothetical protein
LQSLLRICLATMPGDPKAEPVHATAVGANPERIGKGWQTPKVGAEKARR